MRWRGFGERGLVVPNERAETRQGARKGPSRKGFAGKAASRTLLASAVAMATVARLAPHDLRLFRLKRAPRIIDQRFLNAAATRRRTCGRTSRSNHGLRANQALLRGLGCGKGMTSSG